MTMLSVPIVVTKQELPVSHLIGENEEVISHIFTKPPCNTLGHPLRKKKDIM